MVCLEGDVHEDALEAVGFSVWRGLDEGRQPGLQADGRKGRDAGTRGVVVLDEVVFAREVLVEELQAAKAVTGLVVEYSWVQSSGLCSCSSLGKGGGGRRRRTLEGELFLVKFISPIQGKHLDRWDDKRIAWFVFPDLDSSDSSETSSARSVVGSLP